MGLCKRSFADGETMDYVHRVYEQTLGCTHTLTFASVFVLAVRLRVSLILS